MPKLTIDQQVLLEQLTGRQYTRDGKPRKKKRSIRESIGLGLEQLALAEITEDIRQARDRMHNAINGPYAFLHKTIYNNKLEYYQELLIEIQQGKNK